MNASEKFTPPRLVALSVKSTPEYKAGWLPGIVADWKEGDGTDNTPVVLEALDKGKRIIEMPWGDIGFKGEIVAPERMVFRGQSEGATRLFYTGRKTFFSGTGEGDMILPCVLKGFTLFGTAAAQGAIMLSEIYRCRVACTIRGFESGTGLRMFNAGRWTEGIMVTVQVRDTRHAFQFDIEDPDRVGTLSFAETRFTNCSVVLSKPGQKVMKICPRAYVYAFKFGIKVNVESWTKEFKPGVEEMVLVQADSGAAAIDGEWAIYAEQTGDYPFLQFDLADNARVNGWGFCRIMASKTMSASKNAPHPFNRLTPSSVLFQGSNGLMAPGNGDVVHPCLLGVGVTVYEQIDAPIDDTVCALYISGCTVQLTLQYESPKGAPVRRSHEMTLLISTRRHGGKGAGSSDIPIQNGSALDEVEVISMNPPPGISFSEQGNAFLFVTLRNTVPGGVLRAHARIKTFVGNAEGGEMETWFATPETKFGPFRPIVFFPDMNGIQIGPPVAVAYRLQPRLLRPTAAELASGTGNEVRGLSISDVQALIDRNEKKLRPKV